MMRVGSLFTGIGGIDLGLSRAGFEIAWQVEVDEWCRRLLAVRWPEVPKYGDIRECGAHNLAWVDVIMGGFPCQDISSAGKRAGIEGERSGLWREFARIVGELRPRYVLIENVAALLYAMRGPDGRKRPAAITTVLRDLAAYGYDATWRVCSAAECGAPHLRRRVFIVAYVEDAAGAGQPEWIPTTRIHTKSDASDPEMADADGDRCERRACQSESGGECAGATHTGEDGERWEVADAASREGRWRSIAGIQAHAGAGGKALADASRQGLEERNWRGPEPARTCTALDECRRNQGQVESLLGRGSYGLPYWMDGHQQRWPAGPGEEQRTWEPPRVVTERIPDRTKRLKGLGNAALPQIAEAIGYGIKRHAGEMRKC